MMIYFRCDPCGQELAPIPCGYVAVRVQDCPGCGLPMINGMTMTGPPAANPLEHLPITREKIDQAYDELAKGLTESAP